MLLAATRFALLALMLRREQWVRSRTEHRSSLMGILERRPF